jgi:hypothetical protein
MPGIVSHRQLSTQSSTPELSANDALIAARNPEKDDKL